MNFDVLFQIKINTLTEVCVQFKEPKFRSVVIGNHGDPLMRVISLEKDESLYRQAPLFIEKLIDVPYMVSETNPLIILIDFFYIYDNAIAGNLPSTYA